MAERQFMSLVDFPKMPRLPIPTYDLFHSLRLELLPLVFVALVGGWRWHN